MANLTGVSTTIVTNKNGVKVQTNTGVKVFKQGDDYSFAIVQDIYENGVFQTTNVLGRGYDATRSKALSKAKAKIKELLNLKNN